MVRRYIPAGSVVCDLGSGKNASSLKKITSKSRGIAVDLDVSPDLPPDITSIVHNLETSLPIPERSVDVVMSLAVIEHLYKREEHVREAFRILRPGGVLLLTTPAPRGRLILETLARFHLINPQEIHDHKIYLSKSDLEELSKKAGFTNVRIKSFEFGFNQCVIARK